MSIPFSPIHSLFVSKLKDSKHNHRPDKPRVDKLLLFRYTDCILTACTLTEVGVWDEYLKHENHDPVLKLIFTGTLAEFLLADVGPSRVFLVIFSAHWVISLKNLIQTALKISKGH